MIRSAAATILLVALTVALRRIYEVGLGLPGLPVAVSLGFILVASYTFSTLFVPLRLPRICAYMVMGMLCGPFGLKLISAEGVEQLRLIEQIAIALIALTAGGELHWSLLRSRSRSLFILLAVLSVVLLGGTTLGFLLLVPAIAFLRGAPGPILFAAALLMGVTALAKSPSTAVAVLKETRAKGPLSETVLAVLLMLDVAAVVLFAVALGVAEQLIGREGGVRFADLAGVLGHVTGALPVGFVIGLLASVYLRFVRGNYLLFVLLLCLLVVEVSNAVGIELIMMAVVAGFTVENFSDQGDDLMRAIDQSYLPVYVVFFALAGASVNFAFIASNWALTLSFIVIIGGLTWLGAGLGGRLAGLERSYRRYTFMGLIAQAGLNLSFATVIRDRLPIPMPGGLTLGEGLQTLIVARVAVKQFIGPILFRFALARVGEIGGSEGGKK